VKSVIDDQIPTDDENLLKIGPVNPETVLKFLLKCLFFKAKTKGN